MLFDYNEFISDLRNNDEKKQIVDKYEKNVEPIQLDYKKQVWFVDYVDKFSSVIYKTPEDLINDFDWDFLLKLIVSSFSSNYELVNSSNSEEAYTLFISVKSGEQSIVKKIDKLWSYQIQRLFEIYVEEQMNLQILSTESEQELNAITQERKLKIKLWESRSEKIIQENILNKTDESIKNILGDVF